MLILRQMEEKDLPQVAAIEASVFSQPWSEQGFCDALMQKDCLYLVAAEEEKILGYCGLYQSFDEADITNVAVMETERGTGVARAMLTELLEQGKMRGIAHFTLEVRVSNAGAIHLYEGLGFASAGVRKNFYDCPKEDAMIMWRHETLDGIPTVRSRSDCL